MNRGKQFYDERFMNFKSNIVLYIKTLEIAIFIWSCYCSPPEAADMRLQELDTTAPKQLQINILFQCSNI